ncbi:MAG: hypothetical protein IJB65_07905 [Clostridia bacterium]|nr:hypothetical protein [Clostridia bacterium]
MTTKRFGRGFNLCRICFRAHHKANRLRGVIWYKPPRKPSSTVRRGAYTKRRVRDDGNGTP